MNLDYLQSLFGCAALHGEMYTNEVSKCQRMKKKWLGFVPIGKRSWSAPIEGPFTYFSACKEVNPYPLEMQCYDFTSSHNVK